MMLLLLIVFLAVVGVAVGSVYLLGFRLGGEHWLAQLQQVREESARAQRRMSELTRQAFVAMAEEAERRRSS